MFSFLLQDNRSHSPWTKKGMQRTKKEHQHQSHTHQRNTNICTQNSAISLSGYCLTPSFLGLVFVIILAKYPSQVIVVEDFVWISSGRVQLL